MRLEIITAEPSDLYEVWRLNYDAYLAAGYIEPNPQQTWSEYGWLELGSCTATTVLLALMNDRLVGSVTVTKDSPAGLHTDVDFARETYAVRCEQKSLASSWRIVTVAEHRQNAAIVSGLMRAVAKLAIENGLEVVLCTFHPRRERVYRRLFRAETIARRETTKGLRDAPAVLMRFEAAKCPRRWLA